MKKKIYGYELVMDLHGCNQDVLTSKKKLQEYVDKLPYQFQVVIRNLLEPGPDQCFVSLGLSRGSCLQGAGS